MPIIAKYILTILDLIQSQKPTQLLKLFYKNVTGQVFMYSVTTFLQIIEVTASFKTKCIISVLPTLSTLHKSFSLDKNNYLHPSPYYGQG